MDKKVFGVIFIILAALFSLALLLSIPKFAGVIGALFSPHEDVYELSYLIGNCIGFAVIAALATTLWIFGIKWVKKKNNTNDNSSFDTL